MDRSRLYCMTRSELITEAEYLTQRAELAEANSKRAEAGQLVVEKHLTIATDRAERAEDIIETLMGDIRALREFVRRVALGAGLTYHEYVRNASCVSMEARDMVAEWDKEKKQ